MTGPLNPDADREFQRVWNDEAMSLDEVAASFGFTVPYAEAKASRFRSRGTSMRDRRVRTSPTKRADRFEKRDAEILRVWNDASLTEQEVEEQLGVKWDSLVVAVNKLRSRGNTMMRRRKPAPPRPRDPEGRLLPVQSPSLVDLWNNDELDNEALCETTGLQWKSLANMAARLREKGVKLIDRRKLVRHDEPMKVTPCLLNDSERSIKQAVGIMMQQKRRITIHGDFIRLDGRVITVVQLMDEAYGPPPGKYR